MAGLPLDTNVLNMTVMATQCRSRAGAEKAPVNNAAINIDRAAAKSHRRAA